MAGSSWLYLLLLLAATSGGKDETNEIQVKTCPAEVDGNITIPLYKIVHTNHSCMHIAWSLSLNSTDNNITTPIYPSLYIAYSKDTGSCDCQALSIRDNIYESEEGEEDYGFVFPVVESDHSMGFIFKGIYGFPATKKNLAGDGLNLTYACSAEKDAQDDYFSLNQVTEWMFVKENQTFIGHVGNYTRFSIRTGFPKQIGDNRLGYFPKTLFHQNSTTFDFISDNYTCSDNCSRLALEVVLVHGSSFKNGSIVKKWTVDDEYTPSVFSSYTYQTEAKSASLKNNQTWFLQWKPISYQDSSRKSTSSQQVTIVPTGNLEECVLEEIPDSLVSRVYKGNVGNITRWFVVFGTSGDDSSIPPVYNTWTVAIGTGKIPSEKFSYVVYITISVGFGVPGALVILSMVYVVFRRKPWQNVARWMNRGNRGYTKLS